jgi:hypothetical protein
MNAVFSNRGQNQATQNGLMPITDHYALYLSESVPRAWREALIIWVDATVSVAIHSHHLRAEVAP